MSKRKYALVDGKLVLVGGEETKADIAADNERMRGIIESRRAPGLSTDTTFFSGVGSLNDQIKDPRSRKRLYDNARKQGISLTGNEFYQPGLAKYPGDPRACISHAGGKQQIRQMVEATGSGCEGAVSVKPREAAERPKPKHKLNPRIVARHMRKLLADPENAKKDRRELTEKIIHEHGPRA